MPQSPPLCSTLDHLVLTVADIERAAAFYERVCGMRREITAAGRVSLHFGSMKINLHEQGKEFEPKAAHPVPGSADLCFLTRLPIETAKARLESLGVPIIEGPVARTGAQGPMTSLYFRDPDGNLIEVARYGA